MSIGYFSAANQSYWDVAAILAQLLHTHSKSGLPAATRGNVIISHRSKRQRCIYLHAKQARKQIDRERELLEKSPQEVLAINAKMELSCNFNLPIVETTLEPRWSINKVMDTYLICYTYTTYIIDHFAVLQEKWRERCNWLFPVKYGTFVDVLQAIAFVRVCDERRAKMHSNEFKMCHHFWQLLERSLFHDSRYM